MGKFDKVFEVLEPRILLNAVLDFSVSDTVGSADTIESMTALIRNFETQFDPDDTEGLLNLLQTELGDSLGDIADMLALAGGQEGTGYGELEDIFERVRLAGMQVVEDYRSDLDAALLAVDFDTVIDLSEAARGYPDAPGSDPVVTEIAQIDAAGFLRVNGIDVPNGDTDAGLRGYLLSSDVTDLIFGNDLLWSEASVSDRLDVFFGALTIEIGNVVSDGGDPPVETTEYEDYTFQTDALPTTIDAFKSAFLEAYDGIIAAMDTTEIERFELDDIVSTGGASLVTFNNVLDGDGVALLDEVEVSVTLPDIQTMLDRLDLAPNLRAILPVDFGFNTNGGTLNFNIDAETLFDEGVDTDPDDDTTTAQLTLSGFDLVSDSGTPEGALFEFGRPVDADINYMPPLSTDLPETSVGFLTGTLTSIETGRFGLFEANADWSTLIYDGTAVISSDATVAIDVTDSLTGQEAIDFTLRGHGLDTEDGDADYLDALDLSQELDMVRYNFDMDMPLSLDATTGIGFGASLTQSFAFGGLTADGSIVELANGVDVQFAITSFAGVDAAQILPLTLIVDAFYQMDSDVIVTFLEMIGDGLAGVLQSSDFSLGVPLTDFDMTAAFADIAETLQELPDLFAASPADFGFSNETQVVGEEYDSSNLFIEVASETLTQTGLDLTDAQILSLDALGSVTFTAYGPGSTVEDFIVDLTGFDALDAFGVISDMALEDFAALASGALAAAGWAATATGRALSLSVTGAGDIRNIGLTAGAIFRDLGFVQDQLLTNTIDDVDVTTLEVNRGAASAPLGEFDEDVLRGLDSVRFEVFFDDDPLLVNVLRPINGWGADTGGDVAASFASALNLALADKGLGVSVETTTITVERAAATDDDPAVFEDVPSLVFTLNSGIEGRFQISMDLDSLTRANSLQGLMGWMTEIVTDVLPIPAVDITVDLESGEVLFDFEPITAEVSASAGLSIDNTRLGELDNIDLQAVLAGTLSAQVDFAAGFNIFDIQADFATSDDAFASILDNAYLTDLSMNAVLDAQATEIVAGLDLGMIEIGVGLGDDGSSAANFIALNTELDITIVGQDDAAFSDRLTGSQLVTLGTNTGPGSALVDLLGRIDLRGGIAVDEEGCIVDGADEIIDFGQFGDTATAAQVLGLLDIDNGDDRVDGQNYAMIALNFQEITFDLGGIGSDRLNAATPPMLVTVGDIFDPLNTTHLCNNFAELACLTLVNPNLILDAMIGLGDLIEVYADSLEDYFPVLFQDVPLLNDALMASFDFTSDFNAALQELRDAGGFSFANINEVFAGIFGEDVVQINLVTAGGVCELYFDLDISFLDDFTQEIPFNLNLIDLLGDDGLHGLLLEAGGGDAGTDPANTSNETTDALGDILSSLVDARADAALVLDPELGMELRLGLDLMALGAVTLADAAGDSAISDLAGVTSVVTNGAGFNDLRINWVDLTGSARESFSIDIDSIMPAVAGDPLTLDDVIGAIQAQFDAGTNAQDLTIALQTDPDTGEVTITIEDPNATLTDTAGVTALFADAVDSLTVAGGLLVPLAPGEDYAARVIPLLAGVDPELGYTFSVDIAGTGPRDIVVAADVGRDIDDFVNALNTALNSVDPSVPAGPDNTVEIANDALDPSDTSGDGTPLLRLILVRADDAGNLTLETTSVANANGWDEFSVVVADNDGDTDNLFDGVQTLVVEGFTALTSAEEYTPRTLDMQPLADIVPEEFEPEEAGFIVPFSGNFAQAFDFEFTVSQLNGAPDITFTLNLAEDPDRTSAEDFADALTQALRFNDDGTFRAIDVADASTDPLLGGVAFEQIFAGDLFTFAAGTPLNVLMETTSFLQTTGLPDYGFSVSNVTPPADPAPTSPPLLLIDNLTSSAADWEALPASQGFTFAIAIGDGAPVDVVMPADYSRATRADFVDGLNAALQDTTVSRSLISDTALIGTTIPLSQILRFVADADAGTFELRSTNFAQQQGYDEFAFSVVGNDISHDITFEVIELEESNIARALGLASLLDQLVNEGLGNDAVVEGNVTSVAVKTKDLASSAPIVFVDTEATQISANLSLGTPDGLNMVLALGPLEVGIEGGSAFIGRSGGEDDTGDDRGFIRGTIADADGVDDGRYDFAHLYGLVQADDTLASDYLNLFGLEVDFETRIDLPFSGAFGLLNPADHGFIYESTLLRTIGDLDDPNNNVVLASNLFATVQTALDTLAPDATAGDQALAVGIALLDTHFIGDAQALGLSALYLAAEDPINSALATEALAIFTDERAGTRNADGSLPTDYFDAADGAYGPHYIELNLPGTGLFDCAGILDLLNDPLAVINGLDMMAGTIQGFIDDFMSDIDLPLIGDNMSVGASFFDDFVYDVIDPARAYLETPLASGALPTTLDLINLFLNEQMNVMFGTTGQSYMAADINEDGEAAIYGVMSFNWDVFDEWLPVDLALEIPGLNLEVEAGTDINLRSTLDIDLGFGLDCDGFFVLNSLTQDEIALEFTATANDFDGGFSIGGVLDVRATAADTQGNVANADTFASVVIGLDLFGDAGIATGLGEQLNRSYDFDEDAFAGVVAANASSGSIGLDGNRFDNTVYLSQIDFGDFAEFTFNADVSIHLDLLVQFDVGGFVPQIYTDFILTANIPEATFGAGGAEFTSDILITELEFREIHLVVDDLINVVNQVLDPLRIIIDPIADVFDVLSSTVPISYAFSAASSVLPILNIGTQLASIATLLTNISDDNGDGICIGTYDFLGGDPDGVFLSEFRASDGVFIPCLTFAFNFDAQFSAGASGPGLSFSLPLLSDPSHALNLLLGNFDRVSLVEADFNLLQADLSVDIAGSILSSIGLPGWATSAIRGGFYADIDVFLDAGMTVGYDLSGIVNFANTLDPERLLDGVFIDAAPGALINGSIGATIGLNAGIAGATGGVNGSLQLTFTDPNRDGKLRLPEILPQLETAADEFADGNIEAALGAIFNGSISVSAFLRVFAGINLPWPLPDLGFSTTVFDTEIFGYTLNATPVPTQIAEVIGATSVMNVGARAGNNMSSISQDGNDQITIANNGAVTYISNGQNFGPASINAGAGIVIPGGEGNNNINMSGITNSDSASVIYLGGGTDVVNLAQAGTHVVFAGGGNDTINVTGSGTYYIFAEGGADTITVNTTGGGRAYVFADDDFGMRDLFLERFSVGNVAALPVNAANIEAQFAGANMQLGGATGVNLAQFETDFTRSTQLSGGSDDERIIIQGTGSTTAFTGRGDDLITVSATGTTEVFSSAGDDQINFTGLTGITTTEAGAGDDLVTFAGGTLNTVYGWGDVSSFVEGSVDHLLRKDGDDIIIGNSGNDFFYGQYGSDILGGGTGNDTLDGGFDDDLISGGVLEVRAISSQTGVSPDLIDLSDPEALENLKSRLQVETADLADGTDTLIGGAGNDILFGGGDADDLDGGAGSDLLVGDYGLINVSANRTAETFISTGMTSITSGVDVLNGGSGGDILVAGGAQNALTEETITDLLGNNIVFGDFGIVEGTRILEAVNAYRSIASASGTVDNITTGAGNDVIIGGEQGDTINAGTGGDFVIGDLGSFVPSLGLINNDYYENGVVVTNTSAHEGDDIINFGTAGRDDLFDIALGGGGDDMVTSRNGGLAMLGDYGQIQLSPAGVRALLGLLPLSDTASAEEIAAYEAQVALIERIVQSIESIDENGDVYNADDPRFGDDTVRTTQGGNVFTVLGGGDDIVDLAEGLSYIITDDGRLTITQISDGAGSSFGLIEGLSVSTEFAGTDTVTTAGGRDIILTGDMGDTVNAGDGLNIVMTDNGTLTTADVQTAFPTTLQSAAGAGDGDDIYHGGADDDLVVLGGGSDAALRGVNPDLSIDPTRSGLGGGDNYALGDSGLISITLGLDGLQAVTLQSDPVIAGGNDGVDRFEAADSNDFIVLGGGGDVADLGDGSTYLLGGSGLLTTSTRADGSFDVTINAADVVPGVTDGDDTVTSGTGADYVVLDLGEDIADLGDGDVFLLGGAGDLSVIRAADGATAVTLTAAEITVGTTDGDDMITSGVGDDYIVLGLGDDIADLGEGDVFLLGGAGDITVGLGAGGDLDVALTSSQITPGTTDGDDEVTNGLGDEYVVLGLGSDTANLGDGTVHVIGGEGTLTFARTAGGDRVLDMISQDPVLTDLDGDEMITAGSGDDFIILGLGDDFASTGDGENRVVGDQGRISVNTITGFETLTSLSPELGGDDRVLGGADNDIVLLSQGNDYAETFGGDDLIVGDNATMIKNNNTGLHQINAGVEPFGGDDEILGGEGNDLIIGSFGSDTIQTGTGNDFALGDLGNITFVNATDVETLTYTDVEVGAGDIITAEGAGSNILIGQYGEDVLTGGDDDDILIGDLAELTLSSTIEAITDQNHVFRLANLLAIRTDLGFDDNLTGGAGADFLVGGFGNDTLLGGADQDFLFGDMIQINRTFDPATGIELMRIETNFAFVTGGFDVMEGGVGPDVVIGGLGVDLFIGNTQEDVLAGDAFTGDFEALFETGFAGPTPFRDLVGGNFPGNLPGDLLTREQLLSAIGVFSGGLLTNTFGQEDAGVVPAHEAFIVPETQIGGAGTSPSLLAFSLRAIEAFLDNDTTTKRIAELVFYGTDFELVSADLLAAFKEYLAANGLLEGDISLEMFERMLQRVLDDVTVQAQTPSKSTASAAQFGEAAAASPA